MMTCGQAIDLLESDDLTGLGLAANAMRQKIHPERVVSYHFHTLPHDERASTTLPQDETAEQFVSRLERLREAQTESQFVAAVLPRCSGTAVEYLKRVAVARLFLENVPHIQTSSDVGLKVCQIALTFGADDISGEGNERRRPTEEQLRRLIRDAGFVPKQRDALFRTYFD